MDCAVLGAEAAAGAAAPGAGEAVPLLVAVAARLVGGPSSVTQGRQGGNERKSLHQNVNKIKPTFERVCLNLPQFCKVYPS